MAVVSRWPSPAAAGLAAVAAGVHLALGLAMRAPIIHPDEAGQLRGARFLAGRGPAPDVDSFPAYTAVLAPIARAVSSPLELWRGALVVNAILAAATVLLAAALARRLAPEMGEVRRLASVAAAVAYPALVLWSNLAIAENLLIPLVVAAALVLWHAVNSGRVGWWLAAGAIAGAAAGTHPRAVAVPVALLVTALLLSALPDERGRWRPAALVVAGALPVVLVAWIAADRAGGQLGAPAVAGRLGDLPVEIAGQVWYLTVATWGLFPVGMGVALGGTVTLVRRRSTSAGVAAPGPVARAAVLSFVAASVLAMLVLGSLYVREDGTLDSFIYGRAVEGLLVPVLLVGLLGLIGPVASLGGRARTGMARPLAAVAGTMVAAGVVLVLGRGASRIELPVARVNVLGLDGLLSWQDTVLSVALFSGLALAAATVVVATTRRAPVAAAGLMGLLFLPSIVTGQEFMVAGSRQRASERAVADALVAIDGRLGGIPGNCVGYDGAGLSAWHRANYALFFGGVAIRDFSSRRGEQPCSELAVSGREDFATAFPGSRAVMLENSYHQTLWALPGPAQVGLARQGWLLPERLPVPVPAADRRYGIALARAEQAGAIAMRRGARHEVDVTVTHAGRSEPWPNAYGLQSQFQSVRVGVRWYRLGKPGVPDGHTSLDTTRVDLPRTLFPGEQATMTIPLETVGRDGRPLRAGTYQARVEVVQNGVAWFEPVGPPLVIEVVVVGRVF